MLALTAIKRPTSLQSALEEFSERRREVERAKYLLHIAERETRSKRDELSREKASARWDLVHDSRPFISPRAYAYFNNDGTLVHAHESGFLKYASSSERHEIYALNELLPSIDDAPTRNRPVSKNAFYASIEGVFSIQLDVMNAIHYGGYRAESGTTLKDVITGKMKIILRRWLSRRRGASLRQLHLYIDDPNLVL
ncbi:unnamed protein product [Agarophyton chilense]